METHLHKDEQELKTKLSEEAPVSNNLSKESKCENTEENVTTLPSSTDDLDVQSGEVNLENPKTQLQEGKATNLSIICIESDDSQGKNESVSSLKTEENVLAEEPVSRASEENIVEQKEGGGDDSDAVVTLDNGENQRKNNDGKDTSEKEANKANVRISQNMKEKMSTIVQLGVLRAVKSAKADGCCKEDSENASGTSDINSTIPKGSGVIVLLDSDEQTQPDRKNTEKISEVEDETSVGGNGIKTMKAEESIILEKNCEFVEGRPSEKESAGLTEEESDASLVSYLTGKPKRKTQQRNVTEEVCSNDITKIVSKIAGNKEGEGHEMEGEHQVTEEGNDTSASVQLVDGESVTDSTVQSLGSDDSEVTKGQSTNIDGDKHADSDKAILGEAPINETEMEDNERLVIDIDTCNPEELERNLNERHPDWLEDSQRLVIEEVDDTVSGETAMLERDNAQEKSDITVEKELDLPSAEEKSKTNVDMNQTKQCKDDISTAKEHGAASVVFPQTSEIQADVFIVDQSPRKDSTRERNKSNDGGCSNLELTQMLLQLISPSVYTAKPGKRQIKGSILNTKLEASYQIWHGVLNKGAQLFHCFASECRAKFSYTKLILHILLEHGLGFGTTGQSAYSNVFLESRRDNKMYCCVKCDFKTPHSVIYLEHIRCHFIQKPYSCTSCFSNTESGCLYSDMELVDHIKSHHGKESPQNLNIAVQYSTDMHVFLWKHRFVCPVCTSANAFYYFPLYVCHLAEHTPYSVGKNKLMDRNFQYDVETATYRCYGCVYNTRIADAFFEHVRIHLTEGKAVYKCKECNRIFKTLLNFRVHQTTLHPKTFPDVEIIPDSQPQIDETYHMIHLLQGSRTHDVQGVPSVSNPGATTRDSIPTISGPENQQGQGQPQSRSLDQDPSNLPKPPTNTPQNGEDDLVTYSHCKTHDFLTSNYSQYILHLRKEHGNFTNVNFLASEGRNNTIAFKDGYYICTGCAIKTEIREMFQEHMRCHTLTFPYQCTECKKDYR